VRSRKSGTPPRWESASAVDFSMRTQTAVVTNRSTRDGEDEPLKQSSKNLKTNVAYSDLHVLVVEDNLVNQRVLAKQLRSLGMHVAVANHGGEALDYLRTTNFYILGPKQPPPATTNTLSLILMDWEMPVSAILTPNY
jgi:PleD family two-component response regulator